MNAEKLRSSFVIETLFDPGALDLTFRETGRTIIGSAVPLAPPVDLTASTHALGTEFFPATPRTQRDPLRAEHRIDRF